MPAWSRRFDEYYDEMQEAFFGILPPRAELDPQEARILFRFLVEVTTVVLQFLALVPAQYAMIAEGVHTERVFGQGVSLDMRRHLPESLIGRLSGIRFSYETDERGKRNRWLCSICPSPACRDFSFITFPRMLTEDGIKGPAVLLASATSYLLPSPSYHVSVRPNYVLRREGETRGLARKRVRVPAGPRSGPAGRIREGQRRRYRTRSPSRSPASHRSVVRRGGSLCRASCARINSIRAVGPASS